MIERLLTQPRVIFFYLSLVAWPVPWRFSIEHDILVSTSLTSPTTRAISLVALMLTATAGLLLFIRARTRIPGFLLLWPLATLAIESSFLALELVFEHRMYMPLAGMAILAGVIALTLIQRHAAYARLLPAAALLVGIGLSIATMQRTLIWREPLILYQDAVTKAPESSRAWGNLGLSRYEAGDEAGAVTALEKAVELGGGKDAKALENLGVIYMDQGRLPAAARLIRQAYELQRQRPEPSVLNHRGELELAMGNHAAAARFFRSAINVAAWNDVYYWNLALAYEGMLQCPAALATEVRRASVTTLDRHEPAHRDPFKAG
jgi:Flp pilus assembly protein TadD